VPFAFVALLLADLPAAFFLAINTLVDIAYVVIDPRIRYR